MSTKPQIAELSQTMWIFRGKMESLKISSKYRLHIFCNLLTAIIIIISTGCQPAGPTPTQAPIIPPTIPPSILEREKQREGVYQEGIGSRIIIVGNSAQAPYLATACFALDNKWYSNQIYANKLKTPIFQTPGDTADNPGIDELLGLKDTSPPLQAFYYFGDELFLKDGPEIIDEYQPEKTRRVCLNHPGQPSGGSCSNTVFLGELGNVLALDYDLYMVNPPSTNLNDARRSGTVVVAKKITVMGNVRTEGYNLVLVADDIEFVPGSTIDTTPVDRPSGRAIPDVTTSYDYGYGKDGYNGGNVVILGRNVRGPIHIIARGTTGQIGQPDLDPAGLENSITGTFISRSNIRDRFKTPSGDYIDALSSLRTLLGDGAGSPPDPWDVRYEIALIDVGNLGQGGDGGKGGRVSIFVGPGPCLEVSSSLEGGSGAPGGTSKPLTVNPSICPIKGFQERTRNEIHSGGSIYCQGLDGLGGYTRFMYRSCDFMYCQLNNLDPYAASSLQGMLECSPTSFEIPADKEPLHSEQDESPDTCSDRFTFHLAQMRKNGEIAPIGGAIIPKLTGKTGVSGNLGSINIYNVTDTQNLELLDQAGIVTRDSDGNILPSVIDVVPCQQNQGITATDFTVVLLALAPRYPDLMLAKADYLTRSLKDSELVETDQSYQNNYTSNPFGVNRIYLAEHFLDSVKLICNDLQYPSQYPYCTLAEKRKEALQQGFNWLGLPPQLYLPRDPSQIYPYVEKILTKYQDMYTNYTNAQNVLDNTTLAEEQLTASMKIFNNMQNQTNNEYQQRVKEEDTAAIKLKDTFNLIDQLRAEIELNEGPEELIDPQTNSVTDMCPSCGYEISGPCAIPSISVESGILNRCNEPPGWSVGVVWGFIKNIAKAAHAIYTFDLGEVGDTLDHAFDILYESDGFFEGVKTISKYAKLVIDGKTEKVEWGTGVNQDSLVTSDEFKKKVIDPVESGYAAYKELDTLYKGVTTTNPFQINLADIRDNLTDANGEFQKRLTTTYQMEAVLMNSNPQAYAHARSLEDLLKKDIALGREMEEKRRENLLATYNLSLAASNADLTAEEIAYQQTIQEWFDQKFENMDESVLYSQKAVDAACVSAGKMEIRFHYMRYLYGRSEDFMYLRPPQDYDFTRVGLITEDYNDYSITDSDSLIRRFIEDVLIPQNQTAVLQAWIVPADLEATEINGVPTFTLQTADQRANAVCGSTEGLCKLTPVAYWDRVVQDLKEDGVATFEIAPLRDPTFLELSETDREGWNPIFVPMENLERMRVIDIKARVYLNGFVSPNINIVPRMRIYHDPWSMFRPARNIDYESFLFNSVLAQNACSSLVALTDPSNDQRICNREWGFYEDITNDPIHDPSQGTILYSINNLGTVKGNSLFGASVQGKWTIDLTPWLNQFAIYRNVNACKGEIQPCMPIESFWKTFQGIQFVIYFEHEELP